MTSPEYRAMVGCTVVMTDTFAMDINNVGAAFWESGIIPPGVNDILNSRIREPKEKSRELVSALTSKVKTSKRCFKNIMEVVYSLEHGDCMKDLLEAMKKKFYESKGKEFPRKPIKKKTHPNGHSDQPAQDPSNATLDTPDQPVEDPSNATLDTPDQPVEDPSDVTPDQPTHEPPPSNTVTHLPSLFHKNWKFIVITALTLALAVLAAILLKWTSGTDVTPPTTTHTSEGTCHRITKQDKKLVYKTLAEVGDWDSVCLYLDVSKKKRTELQYESIPVSSKIHRCVDAYFDNKLSPCFEDIVRVLCNDLSMRRRAKELAEETGVEYRTVCE